MLSVAKVQTLPTVRSLAAAQAPALRAAAGQQRATRCRWIENTTRIQAEMSFLTRFSLVSVVTFAFCVIPPSGSDSEDSADERQDGPAEGGWIEATGSVVGIAAEYAAHYFCQWVKQRSCFKFI